MKYMLQQYEDGTYGYLGIDGNERYNFKTESKVVCTQEYDEDREDFIAKNNITFNKNQYGSNEKLDKVINNDETDWHIYKEIAEQGYGLNKLVYHKNDSVRLAVAKHGYGLNILANDKNQTIREEVAKQGYGLDILISDEDKYVRAAVAIGAKKMNRTDLLNKLINDKSSVREEIAKQGYGLDKLVNDSLKDVRDAVKNYLTDNNLTLEQWTEMYPEKCVLNK